MKEEDKINFLAKKFGQDHIEKFVQKADGDKLFEDALFNAIMGIEQSKFESLFLNNLKKLIEIDWMEHNKTCPKLSKGEICPRDKSYNYFMQLIDQHLESISNSKEKLPKRLSSNKNKVFISYSHHDKKYLKAFQRHFRPFVEQIEFWDDTMIKAGDEWKEKIEGTLNKSKIAILLVSADFFNSEFITNHELPPLLEAAENRGTKIISVILKPCLFDEYADINKYQSINNPSESLIEMSEANQEKTWIKVFKSVKEILSQKEEITFNIQREIKVERDFMGEGNFVYDVKCRVGHLGYDSVKLQIFYTKIKADGTKEELFPQDIGLHFNSKRSLSIIPWNIELIDINQNEKEATIKLVED